MENTNSLKFRWVDDNLLDGTVVAATQHQASGQIYNVTDGIAVTCMDFFSHHWRWADKSGKPLVLPTRLAQELTRSSEWILRKVLQQQTEGWLRDHKMIG